MNGASIRFSKMRGGTGGVDAWRDQLASAYRGRAGARARTTGTAVPVLNSVHSGTVVSVQDFGAFVQLGTGDTYKDGLLHISCLAGFRPERVDEVVDVGAKVWVKVSEVKHEEGKYSLDMRYVHQKDGKDLDPHNTRGRLPDNGTSVQAPEPPGARASGSRDLLPPKAAAQAAPHSGASLQDGRTAPTKRKKSARDAQLDSEEGSGDEDASDSDLAEQQKKMKKKLKKAAKKLEKAKRKAEKAKARKAEKAKDKKKTKKKKKKASSDDSSSDGASTDSS